MKVKELLQRLATADPDATVLFLGFGDDLDEAVEVSAVRADERPWTHEVGRYDNARYEVYYRGLPEERESGYTNIKTESVRAVVLSEDAEFLASRLTRDDQSGQ